MKAIALISLLTVLVFFTGCNKDNSGSQDLKKEKKTESGLVRSEGTQVASLDKNNDGLVYECPMDFQVISDSAGTCPVCKMDLEEISIADAQKNLDSHYHK